MKINFLTSQLGAACSMFYAGGLSRLEEVKICDPSLEGYDVILLMTYDHKHAYSIKKNFPSVKLGLIDPRNHEVRDSAIHCDFLVLDSIEMEDYWRCVKKPILRYVEYPDITPVKKAHVDKEKIVIGYHGNKIHLECMSETVTPALSELRKRYDIELLVMYTGAPPRKEESWIPDGVSVRHIPWSMENYHNELSKCDIGLVPNNIIHNRLEKSMNETANKYNYSIDDYSLRFKMPSNPGRFAIFGLLGIPVVADFYPSALQYLTNDTGLVACNPSGWEYCLEKLITSSSLRQRLGDGLQNLVQKEFDFSVQNNKLLEFLKTL
jgi:hypothetical protein